MIIHLTGGIRAAGEDLPFFRRMVTTIYESGNTIARNWIETANYNVTARNKTATDVNWQKAVEEIEYAIDACDVVISEVTTYRLMHGYEIANALHQYKPVLMVSRKSFREFAISGVKNPLLEMKVYKDEAELDSIVSDFLKRNAVSPKDRELTVHLSRKVYAYLKRKSKEAGRLPDELLLELAEREIDRQNK